MNGASQKNLRFDIGFAMAPLCMTMAATCRSAGASRRRRVQFSTLAFFTNSTGQLA